MLHYFNLGLSIICLTAALFPILVGSLTLTFGLLFGYPLLRLIINFTTTFVLLIFKGINYLAITLENGMHALKTYLDNPNWGTSILSKIFIYPLRLLVGLLNASFIIVLFTPINFATKLLQEISEKLNLPDFSSLLLQRVCNICNIVGRDAADFSNYLMQMEPDWTSGQLVRDLSSKIKTYNIIFRAFIKLIIYWLYFDRNDFGLGNVNRYFPKGNYAQKIISKPEDLYITPNRYLLGKNFLVIRLNLIVTTFFDAVYHLLDTLLIPIRSLNSLGFMVLFKGYDLLSRHIGTLNFEKPFKNLSQYNFIVYLVIGIIPVSISMLSLFLFGIDIEALHSGTTEHLGDCMHIYKDQETRGTAKLLFSFGILMTILTPIREILTKITETLVSLVMMPFGLLINLFACLYDRVFTTYYFSDQPPFPIEKNRIHIQEIRKCCLLDISCFSSQFKDDEDYARDLNDFSNECDNELLPYKS